MLQINGKTFMNLQEAVQWLLDNNALPFQSSANYVANTEIGLGTIVNPSPAKVRIGSLIFFADSKVSTVIGLTENGFMVSNQFNDLVDDVVYVSNVALNASGHLIVTLSNGEDIDAGLIKQVSNFSINASQHLIANYNDGTNTDLGAIFTGNLNIAGNITATGSISQSTANYSFAFSLINSYGLTVNNIYTRFEVINNILYLIANVSCANETESDITVPAGEYLAFNSPSIDAAYGSKIYDLAGNTVAAGAAIQNTLICAVPALVTKTINHSISSNYIDAQFIFSNRQTANQTRVGISLPEDLIVQPDETVYATARMALTLI